MQFKFNFTKDDFVDFNMNYFENSSVIQKSILKSRILGPVLFMMLPFVLQKLDNSPLTYWLVVFAITSILWIIFIPKYSKYRYKKAVKKLVNQKMDNIFGEKELFLKDDCILIKGEFAESQTLYDAIINVEEREKAIYLYNTSASAIIIPKLAFENVEMKNEFLNFINSKVIVQEPKEKKSVLAQMLDL